ncbi:PREDICTED: receptor-like protein 12 isoform X1 [Nelumbo nucifera]|uniref:Receptor-like protein 12 isoform X1 n=1 Tax=Nelumbo nucifera TaxID=4432 RepID=A0A1U7ZXT8_NELNU|nr:PREDICTED: receptor-like protein 12 isoform X1 [Nelumbo nucifera]
MSLLVNTVFLILVGQLNMLQALLPITSNDMATEETPSFLCKLKFLQILDLSDNQLSGPIPRCLGNFSNSLSVLKLRGNNFHGTIPFEFPKGNSLRTFDLNGNKLTGQLPKSLVNCLKLEVLDFGNNQIEDTFPHWLGSLPELQVLVLRANKFHGSIGRPEIDASFAKFSIIDLSFNNFTSKLPAEYFSSWKAMAIGNKNKSEAKYVGDGYYQDSVTVMNKGLEMKLVRIFTVFKAIDFSHNRFEGEIPEILGNLGSLIVLNLSSNSLTGSIPPSFGKLTSLESLDLSGNKLAGRIPPELRSLTFLAVLNLSNNLLEGLIPQGLQFDTFTNNSYEGNLGLCGFPLSKRCEDDVVVDHSPPMETEDSGSEFDWTAMSIGFGCGLAIGVVTGIIILWNELEYLVRTIRIKYPISRKQSIN